MPNPELLPFDKILEMIDWDKVNFEINDIEEGQPAMPDYERQDVRKLILLAAERWLAQDLVEWQVDGVEEYFKDPNLRGTNTPGSGNSTPSLFRKWPSSVTGEFPAVARPERS